MIRLLSLFLYYFRWQRTMAFTSAVGALSLSLCIVLPPTGDFFALLAGTVLGLGFPLTFAGVAFRQLIGNRRLWLVPDIRLFATAGLVLMAIAAAVLSYGLVASGNAVVVPDPALDPFQTAVVAFCLASVYVVISQWLVTQHTGVFLVFLLPIVFLYAIVNESILVSMMARPLPLAAVTVVLWLWLFATMRRSKRPDGLAIVTWPATLASDDYAWQPRQRGRVTSPAGTLMRGLRDGWGNRVTGTLIALLLTPVIMIAILWIIGLTIEKSERSLDLPVFFLITSVLGGSMQSALHHREWPARLRLLWLRQRGDRKAAWQLLERTLVGDVLLTIATATGIAIVFSFMPRFGWQVLLLYVLSAAVLTTLSSYFGFLTRIAGWHAFVQAIFFGLMLLVLLAATIVIRTGDQTSSLFVVLLALAAIAAGFRSWSRRRLLWIDWCAVRPARPIRAGRTHLKD